MWAQTRKDENRYLSAHCSPIWQTRLALGRKFTSISQYSQSRFQASKPNQKWVTDITYIRTKQGWAYLSTIKDLYDGFIVAHQLANK